MKKVLLLVALLANCVVFAQNKTDWNVSLGGSFPIGKFGDFSYDPNTLVSDCGLMDEYMSGGAASTGFNVGVEALFPRQNEKLSFTLSADIHYNSLNSGAKKFMNVMASVLDYSLQNQVASNGGISISSSCVVDGKASYINVPLLAGLRYTMPMNNGKSFYAEGGVGVNLRFVTPIIFIERMNYLAGDYYYEMNIEERFKYSMKGTLAFRVGLGMNFEDKLSLSAYCYYLGSGDVSATIVAKELTDSSIQPSEQSMQLGTVCPLMAVAKLSFNL